MKLKLADDFPLLIYVFTYAVRLSFMTSMSRQLAEQSIS